MESEYEGRDVVNWTSLLQFSSHRRFVYPRDGKKVRRRRRTSLCSIPKNGMSDDIFRSFYSITKRRHFPPLASGFIFLFPTESGHSWSKISLWPTSRCVSLIGFRFLSLSRHVLPIVWLDELKLNFPSLLLQSDDKILAHQMLQECE